MDDYRKVINFDSYKDKKKIGILLSGGADSAMLLYLLCQMVLDQGNDKSVIPLHGWDMRRQVAYSPDSAEEVRDIVKGYFPTVDLDYVQIFPYFKHKGEDKSKYNRPAIQDYKDRGIIDSYMFGSTFEPPKESGIESIGRDKPRSIDNNPYNALTKKDVKDLYVKYNLMDTLYPATVSCIGDEITPCKTCWWCREKYWAFGSYDGGIQ